jgi:hypothetical protein
MKRLAIAVTAALVLAAVASADTQKKDVDIKASDDSTTDGARRDALTSPGGGRRVFTRLHHRPHPTDPPRAPRPR